MAFETVPLAKWNRLINHGPALLVSCQGPDGRANALAVAWAMPVGRKPPFAALAVSPRHFSYPLIVGSGEFVINVPPAEMLEQLWACGKHTGREVDKFEKFGLGRMPSVEVGAPRVGGCLAYVECRMQSEVPLPGGAAILVGEVVRAECRAGLLDDDYVLTEGQADMLHHLGGRVFMGPGPRVSPSAGKG